jgi:hypothetical protein
LTIQPSHSYTLAYCRPIHLISIEFQKLKTTRAPYQKNFFFPFNCYNLAIREVTLTEIFSTNYWHIKVQDLMVGSRETSFHFDHWPTCFRPNIHQNGPEILVFMEPRRAPVESSSSIWAESHLCGSEIPNQYSNSHFNTYFTLELQKEIFF